MRSLFFTLILLLISQSICAQEIIVKGLFKNGAFVLIDGNERVLKVDKKTSDGITLIEADSQSALIDVNGDKRRLTLSNLMGGNYKENPTKEVRLAPTKGNHYIAVGQINGQPASFLVDTGATYISMSAPQAKALNLDYATGRQVRLSTANGMAIGYQIRLASVSVGSITLNNIDAVVNDGNFPDKILLGNSFLKQLEYSVESNVLILKKNY